MKREPGAQLQPNEYESSPGLHARASDAEAASLLVRLWRATSPQSEVSLRRSEPAGNRYLLTRAKGSSPTILFDPIYYANQLPVFLREAIDPLIHYLQEGWSLGLSPHIAFDGAFLGEQLGIAVWKTPPLLAYFETPDEISPHPLFDVGVYGCHVTIDSTRYARLFEMFLASWAEFRAPFSRLFSLKYYERLEPAVRFGNVNPLTHYLAAEIARRRDANPMVHNRWYDKIHPAKPGQPRDPLVRFARMGLNEGHLPNPFAARELKLADSESYVPPDLVLQYVDVQASDKSRLGRAAAGSTASADSGASMPVDACPEPEGPDAIAKLVLAAGANTSSRQRVAAQSSGQIAD